MAAGRPPSTALVGQFGKSTTELQQWSRTRSLQGISGTMSANSATGGPVSGIRSTGSCESVPLGSLHVRRRP
jgi:hypothetical protein